MRNLINNIQYLTLVLLIVGQCAVGYDFVIGQFIYLGANGVSTWRTFALKRPTSDKIKEVSCLAITIGLLVMNYIIKR